MFREGAKYPNLLKKSKGKDLKFMLGRQKEIF